MISKSMKDLEKYHKEVLSKLRKTAKYHPAPRPWYYNSSFPFLADIPAPVKKQILKKGFSFSSLSISKQKKIWKYIFFKGEYHELLTLALSFYAEQKKELTTQDWQSLKRWTNRIDNWAHSDSLSDLFAVLFEKFPKAILPTLKQWNSSKKPWVRRQSVVSLFYYSSQRKRFPTFKVVSSQILTLLEDQHIYVQKGVGWTLRESFNIYPKQTFSLLKKKVCQLHPAAWQAATEKLSSKQKNVLLSLRKNCRSK